MECLENTIQKKLKKRISEKLKGRIVSEETRKKIGDFHRGKVYGEETKSKISKARLKIRKIENIHTGEVVIMSLTNFCKLHLEYNANSMRKSCQEGWIYHKTYKITNCEASNGDISSKSGENGEPPEVDNPVGSIGSV